MLFLRILAVFIFLLSVPACAGRRPAPARPAGHPYGLSGETRNKVERLYYRAVSAYTDNDMRSASGYLDEILRMAPGYPPALELRAKIRRVSGKK